MALARGGRMQERAATPTRRRGRARRPEAGLARRPVTPLVLPPGLAAGRFAPQVVHLPEPRARRATREHIMAIAAAEARFNDAAGVLAVRGPGTRHAIDRLTRAARERAVDQAVAALNDAEASRRTLAASGSGVAAAARSVDQERSLKTSMLARFRSGGRQRQRAPAAEPLLTLHVRPSNLTAAGRAALAVLLREASVDARR